MVLAEAEFDEWCARQSPNQVLVSRALRAAVLRGAPMLDERVNVGRWLEGYVFYTAPGGSMVMAMGFTRAGAVAFHSMPWYGSPELRARYAEVMAPYVAGKSCFHFTSVDLPGPALAGIIAAVPRYLEIVNAN